MVTVVAKTYDVSMHLCIHPATTSFETVLQKVYQTSPWNLIDINIFPAHMCTRLIRLEWLSIYIYLDVSHIFCVMKSLSYTLLQ